MPVGNRRGGIRALAFSAVIVLSGTAIAHTHAHHRQATHVHHRAKHTYVRAHSGAVTASYYGWRQHGRHMANGQRFQPLAMTAASKTLPLGTRVRVTNLTNHRSATVLVTDRMRQRGRAIDLSLGAAQRLGMQKAGLVRVLVQRVA